MINFLLVLSHICLYMIFKLLISEPQHITKLNIQAGGTDLPISNDIPIILLI